MRQLILVENFDDQSPAALLEANEVDQRLQTADNQYAAAIDFAIQATGCNSPEATIFADLYRDGTVKHSHIYDLEPTINCLEPLDSLAAAVRHTSPAGPDRRKLLRTLRAAQTAIDLREVLILNKDGLVGRGIDNQGRVELHVDDDFVDTFGSGSEAGKVADSLGLTYFGFEHELIWERLADGQQRPRVLPGREHTALGVLGSDDTFSHVVTVL